MPTNPTFADRIRLTAPKSVLACVELPRSKSLSARLLLLNRLSGQTAALRSVARCADTDAMQRGLQLTADGVIDVGPAGTAMRFLTAYYASQPGRHVLLTGSDRMCRRPIGPLVDALRRLGADITYTANEGFPPIDVRGKRLRGGELTINAGVSSQFVSALLMTAPLTDGLVLHLDGDLVSRPYIDMTIGLMRQYGADVRWTDACTVNVAGKGYQPPQHAVDIEADWSAASYWMAIQLLLPDSHIALRGLQPDSLQGDSRLLAVMQQMGLSAQWHADGTLRLGCLPAGCCCCTTFADLSGTPDVAQTLVVTLCLLGRSFRLTGLRTLRIKETDRLEALRTEMAKLGYALIIEGDDAISWHFAHTNPARGETVINTYDDHRMAMSMAIACIAHPGLTILNPGVVVKSYPDFWQHLQQAGFVVEQA